MRRVVFQPVVYVLLVCLGAALLSGYALFFAEGYRGRSWLDSVFLLAVMGGLLVGVSLMFRAAKQTVDRYLHEDKDHVPHRVRRPRQDTDWRDTDRREPRRQREDGRSTMDRSERPGKH